MTFKIKLFLDTAEKATERAYFYECMHNFLHNLFSYTLRVLYIKLNLAYEVGDRSSGVFILFFGGSIQYTAVYNTTS